MLNASFSIMVRYSLALSMELVLLVAVEADEASPASSNSGTEKKLFSACSRIYQGQYI
jgi:hypothetical protein